MPRRVVFMLVSMVLGVATTVGLAWRAAYVSYWLSSAYLEDPPGPRIVEDVPESVTGEGKPRKVSVVELSRAWGTELWDVSVMERKDLPEGFGSSGTLSIPGWVSEAGMPWERGESGPIPMERQNGMTILARGWPTVTMWSEAPVHRRADAPKIQRGGWYVQGLLRSYAPRDLSVLPSAASHDMPLPIRPIWVPFVMWSLVFGVGWGVGLLVVVSGPGAVRRWSRRRRGRCPGCGYDRSTIGVGLPCPECGLGVSRG